MRQLCAFLMCAVLSLPTYAANATQSFWLLEKNDGHTWCGYTSVNDFKAEAGRLRPTDFVRATYSHNRLSELTYQVDAESGDWIVIDRYTPLDNRLLLKRANLLVQPGLNIVQETTIDGGKARPFRVVSAKSLRDKEVDIKVDLSKIDYPPVPVITNMSAAPFITIITEMQRHGTMTLCKRMK